MVLENRVGQIQAVNYYQETCIFLKDLHAIGDRKQ